MIEDRNKREYPVLPPSDNVPVAIQAALSKYEELRRLTVEAQQKAALATQLADNAAEFDAAEIERALEAGKPVPPSVAEDRRRARDQQVAQAVALERMRDAAHLAVWDALNEHRGAWVAAELPAFQRDWAQAREELQALEVTLARLEQRVQPITYASSKIIRPFAQYGQVPRLANGDTGRAIEALKRSMTEVERLTLSNAEAEATA